MLKLLSTMLLEYCNNGLTRLRRTDGPFTVIMYDLKSPIGTPFTRIDIYTNIQNDKDYG
jgi:hypothetical protein